MLSENEYRNVAASVLLNLCAYCSVILNNPDASEHLSSALTTVSLSIANCYLEELLAFSLPHLFSINILFVRTFQEHVYVT
jgi:hypothetical protein